jgi:hypothetical protein
MSETSNMRNVIEYLITKLESRSRYMQKVRLATMAIKGFDDFLENKTHMVKTFTEIEDDLNQGANALKVLNIQNRDFSEQIQQLNRQLTYKDSKESVEIRLVKDLSDKNSFLQQEIGELKHILDEKDSHIAELAESIGSLEAQLYSQNYYNSDRDMKENFTKVVEENALMKLQLDVSKKKGKSDTKADGDSLKNLMEEKQNSKRKINEKIKDHLSNMSRETGPSSHSPRFSSEKHQMLENILEKVSTSDDKLLFVTKAYGNDFMNNLVNGIYDEQYLKIIDESLKEYEKLEKEIHGKQKKGRQLTHNDLISERNEEEEQSETERKKEQRKGTNRSRSNSKTGMKRSNSTSVIPPKGHNKPFEKNLRSYNTIEMGAKKFNNFTNPSSGYFDKGAAAGGNTKVDYSEQIRKRNLNRNQSLNKSCEQ